jgi:hypothetical protein
VRGLKGGGFYFYANEKAMEGLKRVGVLDKPDSIRNTEDMGIDR